MQITTEEVQNGKLTDETLMLAVRTLRDAGYVVLDNVFAPSFIANLRRDYDAALEKHIESRGGMEGINAKSFGVNHIGLHLPLAPPFSDPQIVANPIAVQVMAAVLGDDLTCAFYHSNTAYPGSGFQPIHRDTSLLFGTELPVSTPPVSVVLNVPLCDFTEENGSTEVWPGTHLLTDRTADERKAIAARAETMGSVRTNVPIGSLIIRDLRMWHRGMPNNADHARAMLAIVYTRGFLHTDDDLKIPKSTWDSWPEAARKIFRRNTIL